MSDLGRAETGEGTIPSDVFSGVLSDVSVERFCCKQSVLRYQAGLAASCNATPQCNRNFPVLITPTYLLNYYLLNYLINL
jgi:hypothetical protein